MILAAGLGTRLRPLTDHTPKALIDVGGRPMLEHVALRLIAAGATRLIVNAHHHAEQVARFVAERNGFGVETMISDESGGLLETGGGLVNAARYFRREAPFLLHNVDILSDIDLAALYREHLRSAPLATLAVMDRGSVRYLAFDEERRLCGYGNSASGLERLTVNPKGETVRFGFTGVHVVSPRIFDLTTERGAFSIIDLYHNLAEAGERIEPYDVSGALWIDIGKPQQLERARGLFEERDASEPTG